MAEPFYITTAISYPNGRPHIGHAYEAIATDAIARYQRLSGRDVFFMTGTDEHGLKMAQEARKRGIEPRALADEMSSYFKEMDDAHGARPLCREPGDLAGDGRCRRHLSGSLRGLVFGPRRSLL
jgi:methionyl-tRNA synthetase